MPSILGSSSFNRQAPDPRRFTNWRDYAEALRVYVADGAKVDQATQPEAIQLIHLDTTSPEARTVSDGIMVYDPVLARIMVVVGGVWRKVTLE